MFSFRLFDAVTDPIAANLTDSWLAKGRSRQSFLLLVMVGAPLGLCLTFYPNFDMDMWLRYTCIALGLFLFFVGYTLYGIPYWSMMDDMAGEDENARKTLSNILGAGIMVSTGVCFALTPLLIEEFGFFWGAVALSFPCLIMMYLGARVKTQKTSQNNENQNVPFMEALKAAFQNKKFIVLIGVFLVSQMSLTIISASSHFLATELLSLGSGGVVFLMVPVIGTACISFTVIPTISKKLGWEKTIIWSAILLGIVYIGAAFFGKVYIGSPKMSALANLILAGPMIAALIGLEGVAITESAREQGASVSLYFGVYNLMVKGGNGLAILIVGILTERFISTQDTLYIRLMPIFGGTFLLVGILIYLWVHRKKT